MLHFTHKPLLQGLFCFDFCNELKINKMKKIFFGALAILAATISGCKKDKADNSLTPEAPVLKADFTIEKATSFAPLKIKLSNTSKNAERYEWHISNNQGSTAVSPEFMLARKGIYTVKLIAYKGNSKDSVTKQVIVENDPAMKAAYFFSRNWNDSSDYSNYISSGNGLLIYEKDRKNKDAACINLGDLGGALFLPDNLLKNTGNATTLSIWFKAATHVKNPLLGCWQTGAETTIAVPCIYFDDAEKLRLKFPTGAVSPQITVSGLAAGTWHHIVLSGNGTVQKAYVNGILAGEITDAPVNYGTMNFAGLGTAYVPGGNTWPGISGSTWTNFNFKGRLDDVRIYNRMLTDKEVLALYEE
jgi:Concanavalin A-like lectin/glucanases superfamily